MLTLSAMVIGAYLLGSISTAILVSRILKLSDPRDVGSGNPGATNVLRYAGKKAAAVTLLGDAVKGVIPVIAGRSLGIESPEMTLVAAAAFCGHLFPIYYGFKGGKGVATFLGVNLALVPMVGLVFVLTWLLTAGATRYSSLAALVATLIVPIAAWYAGEPMVALLIYAAMGALIFWRHGPNIANLMRGDEKKIGQKS